MSPAVALTKIENEHIALADLLQVVDTVRDSCTETVHTSMRDSTNVRDGARERDVAHERKRRGTQARDGAHECKRQRERRGLVREGTRGFARQVDCERETSMLREQMSIKIPVSMYV